MRCAVQLESRVHVDLYEGLQTLAVEGCGTLHGLLKALVTQRCEQLVPSLGPTN